MLILPLANWICIALNKRLYCVFLLFSLRSLRMKSPPQCCQDISTEEYEKKGPQKAKEFCWTQQWVKVHRKQSSWDKTLRSVIQKDEKNSSVQYFHWWSNWRGNWFSNLNKAPDLWSFCHNIDENISPLWWFMFIGNKNIKYSVK